MDTLDDNKGSISPFRVYDLNEASNLLGVNRKTVYQLQEKGDLPKKLVGRGYKFLGEDLLRFMGSASFNEQNNK